MAAFKTLDDIEVANKRVLVYTRSLDGETLLVVVNLSRFSQAVELELKQYEGATPVELFGHHSDMARTITVIHNHFSPGLFLYKLREMLVRYKNNLFLSGNRLNHFDRVRRSTADIAFCLDLGGSIDVTDNHRARMF